MKGEHEIITEFLKTIASKGGKARAAKHSQAELRKWAKLGGRPKKKTTRKGK